jgi:hypothetical protein
MIRISSEVKASSFGGTVKNFITCPQCLKQDWFYQYILRTCSSCSFNWGNVMLLMDDINARKQFYKEGEIIEKQK